mmetsp:Transcript_56831/g.157287  ORF Transcript_56831/g.157287 Transcript_56831/m.157287 type:complete len:93 (-) Transcript_56831:1076-1354(-)
MATGLSEPAPAGGFGAVAAAAAGAGRAGPATAAALGGAAVEGAGFRLSGGEAGRGGGDTRDCNAKGSTVSNRIIRLLRRSAIASPPFVPISA